MAVISWNLDAGRGDIATLVDDLTSGRLTAVAPRAFVLLLQEAVDKEGDPSPTLGRLAHLHLSTTFAPVREIDGRVRGNAIVSTLPLEDVRVLPLPRERQPRLAIIAAIELDAVRLVLVSVHLENRVSWWRGGLLSDSARGRQASALVAAIPAGAGVLGGDLNTWLGAAEPAWRTLNTRFPDLPASRRDVTFRDRLPLDHVLFDVPDGWLVERRVLPEAYGSDHHPVLGLIYD